MAGLTDQGFTPKTQDEIKSDIETKLRAYFGDDLNLSVGSRFGTLVDVFSFEVADTWLALQADYNSRFRNTASGMNLDNVATITNARRRYEQSSSVACYIGGPNGGVTIPSGVRVKVAGGDTRQFYMSTIATISQNSYLITCDQVPNNIGGALVFSWGNTQEITVSIGSNPASIASTIESVLGLSGGDVTVLGDLYTLGSLHITFNNTNPTVGAPIVNVETTDLKRHSTEVAITTGFASANTESFIGIDSTSESILIRSVTELVSNDPNFTQVINYAVGTPGTERELDSEFRERISNDLQAQGKATVGGFRQQLVSLQGVSTVNIVENQENFTDATGRPPHSIEVFVDGGSDDAVAQTIATYKPLGIKNVSTTSAGTAYQRSGAITDANGVPGTLFFSSSIQITVFAKVIITIDSSFPANGETLVKENLVAAINDLGLGKPLHTYKLYGFVARVPGVVTANTLVGLNSEELSSNNITPESFQRLVSSQESITVERSV